MTEIARAFQLASLPIPVCVFAADFSGPVVCILDGDTIEVLHNQHPERIRFNGIDRPEEGQVYGRKPKQFTATIEEAEEAGYKIARNCPC